MPDNLSQYYQMGMGLTDRTPALAKAAQLQNVKSQIQERQGLMAYRQQEIQMQKLQHTSQMLTSPNVSLPMKNLILKNFLTDHSEQGNKLEEGYKGYLKDQEISKEQEKELLKYNDPNIPFPVAVQGIMEVLGRNMDNPEIQKEGKELLSTVRAQQAQKNVEFTEKDRLKRTDMELQIQRKQLEIDQARLKQGQKEITTAQDERNKLRDIAIKIKHGKANQEEIDFYEATLGIKTEEAGAVEAGKEEGWTHLFKGDEEIKVQKKDEDRYLKQGYKTKAPSEKQQALDSTLADVVGKPKEESGKKAEYKTPADVKKAYDEKKLSWDEAAEALNGLGIK